VKLLVATSNPGKLVEIREILGALPLELLCLRDLALPAPDETGVTFHENAAQKAVASAARSGLWALGDDSGLCVDALDGAPGVYSARYAATDEERRAKLLRALKEVSEPRRGAHFFCALALSAPDGQRIVRAEGRVEGAIALAARGTNGFGYDPIFLPAQTPGKTLAELPAAEKNRLSHRGRALQRLLPAMERLARGGAP
jgi:XTP/dITP diphosphohydrolase